jgi:hypothetical protein
MVAAVNPLDPRRTISERRIDAGLSKLGHQRRSNAKRKNHANAWTAPAFAAFCALVSTWATG